MSSAFNHLTEGAFSVIRSVYLHCPISNPSQAPCCLLATKHEAIHHLKTQSIAAEQ